MGWGPSCCTRYATIWNIDRDTGRIRWYRDHAYDGHADNDPPTSPAVFHSCSVDPDGNVVASGNYNRRADPVWANPQKPLYVVRKYSPSGGLLWSWSEGPTGFQSGSVRVLPRPALRCVATPDGGTVVQLQHSSGITEAWAAHWGVPNYDLVKLDAEGEVVARAATNGIPTGQTKLLQEVDAINSVIHCAAYTQSTSGVQDAFDYDLNFAANPIGFAGNEKYHRLGGFYGQGLSGIIPQFSFFKSDVLTAAPLGGGSLNNSLSTHNFRGTIGNETVLWAAGLALHGPYLSIGVFESGVGPINQTPIIGGSGPGDEGLFPGWSMPPKACDASTVDNACLWKDGNAGFWDGGGTGATRAAVMNVDFEPLPWTFQLIDAGQLDGRFDDDRDVIFLTSQRSRAQVY